MPNRFMMALIVHVSATVEETCSDVRICLVDSIVTACGYDAAPSFLRLRVIASLQTKKIVETPDQASDPFDTSSRCFLEGYSRT